MGWSEDVVEPYGFGDTTTWDGKGESSNLNIPLSIFGVSPEPIFRAKIMVSIVTAMLLFMISTC
jgi:hypothetical protein